MRKTGRQRRLTAAAMISTAVVLLSSAGCSQAPPEPAQLQQTAVNYLAEVLETTPRPIEDTTLDRSGRAKALQAQYQLHAQALEVLSENPQVVRPEWLTRALTSPSDIVRYAALRTVARLVAHDGGRLSMAYVGDVRRLAEDTNPYLRLAAAFALFKLLRDPASLKELPGLLSSDNPHLREETALVLAEMPETNPQLMLRARLKEEPDPEVQSVLATRLAILGTPEGGQDADSLNKVINLCTSPDAAERTDAVRALGRARLDDLGPLRRVFAEDRQEELQIEAARALALHGDRRGAKLARKWLNFREPEPLSDLDRQRDPLHEYRVRILAALALGAIGDFDAAAAPLLEAMTESPSRRFRLAAASAALELLRRSGRLQSSGRDEAPGSPGRG